MESATTSATTTSSSKRKAATPNDKRKKKKKRQREARKEKKKDERPHGRAYVEVVKENRLFEEYYKAIGIVSPSEWDQFMSCLKLPLPATFRLAGCRSSAVNLLRALEQTYFKELQEIEVEGEKVPPPRPLPWYPDQLAWHIDLTRKFIRKSPLMQCFHHFLVDETELGNISRQEAVSMIPPLLLDVKPHHKVLDMCAAPGSKTSQIIESLHAEDTEENPVPSGVVVANDADNKRCYMLVHQAKRLNSPCVMVTNHDATVLPNMYYHMENGERVPLMYDRILCDVPCSGDGTLRKNVTIWKSWSPGRSLGLHKIQLSILLRGLELLSPGGRLVYSTCSFNPVENEAVIAAALNWCKGTVELVDVSKSLPALKCVPGVASWKVMAKDGDWIERIEDVPKDLKDVVPSTAFPPSPEEHQCLHLERCMRLLPHHEDSGGFFVSVLVKKGTLPWRKKQKVTKVPEEVNVGYKEEEVVGSAGSTVGQGESGERERGGEPAVKKEVLGDTRSQEEDADKDDKMTVENPLDRLRIFTTKKRNRGFKEDPFVFVTEGNALWESIQKYYGFTESFPTCQMLTRSETGKKRNFYFASNLLRELTIRNEHTVKIINIGTKTLARCTHKQTQCEFRLVQEGLPSILPYIKRQVVSVSRVDLVLLLRQLNPLFTTLSDETHRAFDNLDLGPCVVVYKPLLHEDHTLCESIALSTWRAVKSARLFVSEKERTHFLTILGEEAPRNIKAFASRDNILPKETNEDVVLEEDSFQEEEPSILEKVDKDYLVEESKSEEETDSDSQDKDCET